ncbi:hypothetical protein HK405_002256 [Cladochytrium tenue]|nr:hypothetical protein HK405_002256 [Cladochytrium tenue]
MGSLSASYNGTTIAAQLTLPAESIKLHLATSFWLAFLNSSESQSIQDLPARLLCDPAISDDPTTASCVAHAENLTSGVYMPYAAYADCVRADDDGYSGCISSVTYAVGGSPIFVVSADEMAGTFQNQPATVSSTNSTTNSTAATDTATASSGFGTAATIAVSVTIAVVAVVGAVVVVARRQRQRRNQISDISSPQLEDGRPSARSNLEQQYKPLDMVEGKNKYPPSGPKHASGIFSRLSYWGAPPPLPGEQPPQYLAISTDAPPAPSAIASWFTRWSGGITSALPAYPSTPAAVPSPRDYKVVRPAQTDDTVVSVPDGSLRDEVVVVMDGREALSPNGPSVSCSLRTPKTPSSDELDNSNTDATISSAKTPHNSPEKSYFEAELISAMKRRVNGASSPVKSSVTASKARANGALSPVKSPGSTSPKRSPTAPRRRPMSAAISAAAASAAARRARLSQFHKARMTFTSSLDSIPPVPSPLDSAGPGGSGPRVSQRNSPPGSPTGRPGFKRHTIGAAPSLAQISPLSLGPSAAQPLAHRRGKNGKMMPLPVPKLKIPLSLAGAGAGVPPAGAGSLTFTGSSSSLSAPVVGSSSGLLGGAFGAYGSASSGVTWPYANSGGSKSAGLIGSGSRGSSGRHHMVVRRDVSIMMEPAPRRQPGSLGREWRNLGSIMDSRRRPK